MIITPASSHISYQLPAEAGKQGWMLRPSSKSSSGSRDSYSLRDLLVTISMK
ncbi:MAG: hypothetical protein QE493_03115 [Verrucomicrobiae bacterium]|nr:hypothetical protein [Verrucomicrobiae bacterium]